MTREKKKEKLAGRVALTFSMAQAAAYRLHVYDHCPYCSRVELLMSKFKIPYERIVYGYGEGADPKACDGHGYGSGPVELTGKKMLPVLEKDPSFRMPESLTICSFLVGEHGLVCPPDSGRDDIAAFSKGIKEAATALTRPRIVKMKVKDWADDRDVAYARWKYETKQNFDYQQALDGTPQHVDQVNAKLLELESLIHGEDSLNAWGFGMDDVILLPSLRLLTCVEGVVFPEKVASYMAATLKESQLVEYTPC